MSWIPEQKRRGKKYLTTTYYKTLDKYCNGSLKGYTPPTGMLDRIKLTVESLTTHFNLPLKNPEVLGEFVSVSVVDDGGSGERAIKVFLLYL
jgi:hypothetical protein